MTRLCSRRHFLYTGGYSLAGLGLLDLLSAGARAADKPPSKPELDPVTYDLAPKQPHFAPKAKAMISLYMVGGPSHIDLFDYKPELVKLDGKPFPGQVKYDNPAQASTRVQAPLWKFRHFGKSGMHLSELLPHLGGVADDVTLFRSMHTGVNNHIPSMYALNAGGQLAGRPTLGSWLLYGLGCETKELPAYVALTHPAGGPLVNSDNWSNGWLPSLFQGTAVRPKEPRILNLDPPDFLKGGPQRAQLDLLRTLNGEHLRDRPGETDLAARVANYELAARMQLAAKDVFDLSGESKETLELYGVNDDATRDYGTRCLIARRLVERGVRFVQVFDGDIAPWDSHDHLVRDHKKLALASDQPIATLLSDLKRLGLWDETLVVWASEFGRTATAELNGNTPMDRAGRDHNHEAYSVWLAGGGVKGGQAIGETDDLGVKGVKDRVHVHDLHATILHLLGFDHEKLTYRYAGRDFRLTDVHGHVVKAVLA